MALPRSAFQIPTDSDGRVECGGRMHGFALHPQHSHQATLAFLPRGCRGPPPTQSRRPGSGQISANTIPRTACKHPSMILPDPGAICPTHHSPPTTNYPSSNCAALVPSRKKNLKGARSEPATAPQIAFPRENDVTVAFSPGVRGARRWSPDGVDAHGPRANDDKEDRHASGGSGRSRGSRCFLAHGRLIDVVSD